MELEEDAEERLQILAVSSKTVPGGGSEPWDPMGRFILARGKKSWTIPV